ncbi:hypothetical protein N9L68_00095 [bacterium]|nr:hypothetical protein [bacterium]
MVRCKCCYRNTKGFADCLNNPGAMQALRRIPLLPLTKKQRGMIGEERVLQSTKAQLRARGLSCAPAALDQTHEVSYFPSSFHGDPRVGAAAWSARVVRDVALCTRKTGNHVCRPDVCHRGRIGKRGCCRMLFWNWCRRKDMKKGHVAQMRHGLELQPLWNGTGALHLHVHPPVAGLPAPRTTHPFDFKMSPGVLLGPKCNQDIGVLLRLAQQLCAQTDGGVSRAVAEASMLETMGDHEYYCASYCSKDQPQITGLLMYISDGLRAKEADIAAAHSAGGECWMRNNYRDECCIVWFQIPIDACTIVRRCSRCSDASPTNIVAINSSSSLWASFCVMRSGVSMITARGATSAILQDMATVFWRRPRKCIDVS